MDDLSGELNGLHILAVSNLHDRLKFVAMAKVGAYLSQASVPLTFADMLALYQHPGEQQQDCRIHLAAAVEQQQLKRRKAGSRHSQAPGQRGKQLAMVA
jgi:hypothetical protein